MTSVPLDSSKLTPASRRFAVQLFAFAPDVEQHATMEADEREPGAFLLLVQIPSPTGDAHRALIFWMNGDEPSLQFGAWHTHAYLFGGATGDGALNEFLDFFRAIRNDEAVLCKGVATNGHHYESLLDLREPDALQDELTSPVGTGELELLSWSGSGDRRVSVRD